MIKFSKALVMATVGALVVPAALMAAPATAQGHVYQDAVVDSNGKVVTDFNGNCVMTKWEGSKSKCAGHAVMTDVRKLSKEQRTVYFDFNKSTINAAEKAKLDSLVKIIAASKEVESVDIVGFADKLGKPGYNKALSTRRAASVKAFLASKGLKTHKVRVEGLGATKPVTSCDTKEARAEVISCLAEDRRVEIVLNFVK